MRERSPRITYRKEWRWWPFPHRVAIGSWDLRKDLSDEEKEADLRQIARDLTPPNERTDDWP